MALLHLDEPGSLGVLSGVPPHEVPARAWTAGRNVRMVDGSVHKFLGHIPVFGTPSVAPFWLLPIQTTATYYWLYASLAKVYVTDGATHYNITRQTAGSDVDYAATTLSRWNGGIIGGIPVINNGVDVPQMWNPTTTATKLQALTAWDAAWKAAVVRVFKNYIIALDITKSSTRYAHMVKWSHAADPGAVPTSWDEADPTKDAGEVELAETGGILVDCKPLRGLNVIYKEDATLLMQYIGVPFIFRFDKAFGEFGLLTRDCVVEFFGKHFLASRDDLIIHNGQEAKSIFDTAERKKMASTIFNSIDATNYTRAHIAAHLNKSEIWFCYPETGSTYCNKAFIYNWRRNTLSLRDLPNVNYTQFGVVSPTEDQTWDSDSGVWDMDSTIWDARTYNPTLGALLGAGTNDTQLYNFDNTNQVNGVDMTSYIERTQLVLGDTKPGATGRMFIREVWPRMRASGPVNFYIGGQDRTVDGVVWQGPFAFNPNTDKRILCSVNTPMPAIKIESTTNIYWELDGLSLDVVPAGKL